MGFIYWIASYPKSGNTWMRAFLAALVTGGIGDDLSKLKDVAPDENAGRYFQPFLRWPIALATNADLAAARPHAHRMMAAQTEGFQFRKTHSLVAKHLGTATITADVTAGAIYLLRNPLDVVVSYSDFRAMTLDQTIGLVNKSQRILTRPKHGAYEIVGSWSENVASWTKPNERILVLRYEDLLSDPQANFRRVAAFLRMDVTPELVGRAIEGTSFQALQAAEQAKGFGERPKETKAFFRSGRAGEWRDRLGEEQVARVVTACQAGMRRFGYWQPEFDDLALRQGSTAAGAAGAL